MSEDNKTPDQVVSNVLQFPTRKKDADVPPTLDKAPANNSTPDKSTPTKKGSKKAMAATVLAISLLTVAVNKHTFDSAPVGSTDMASVAGDSMGRKIASVERMNFTRNPQWEKQLADSMSSVQVRDVASAGVGRTVTVEEKLRWGTLEEKYTITYSAAEHEINSILLQDPVAKPSYILDRPKFLTEYGHLFKGSFDTARLKSVEKSEDKTVESYTLFDKENKARGEARFELDRHKRLISLKVEPVQI